ncbi:MAG: RNA polymerase subunit sigma-24 [Marivirga sp.]|nr:RNA polymerase subunit sigma-24 [Marivirga sp.]
MLTDEEIVARIINGEKHLYELLIRKYNRRLYRISRSIINEDEEVEDIMQTAYLNAYTNLKAFKNKSMFSTWLTKILINESLLHKRRRIKLDQILIEKHELNYHDETPLTGLMNSELKIILEKSIAVLPEKYRLVFVMREIEEMSTNETMETLNLTESNVKVRLTRAKEMLRDALSSHYRFSGIYDFHLTRCDKITNQVMAQIKTISTMDGITAE